MSVLNSLFSAFLMYSRIPVPQVEWREENRRYALCFFPLVGAVVGGVFLLWRYICDAMSIGRLLSGAVSAVIPLIVTGGIHMDGFCDVVDAGSSFGDRQKKLNIMSDPHIGSFSAIWLGAYLIVHAALLSEIAGFRTAAALACSYVLSRSLSGIAAVTFKGAKKEGALQSFVKPAHKKITVSVLLIITACACSGMMILSPVSGGAAIICAGLSFVYYRISAYRNFGGITGDTAGWFLQICELSTAAAAVFGEKLTEVLCL